MSKRTNMADEQKLIGFSVDKEYDYDIVVHRSNNKKSEKTPKYAIINSPLVHLLGKRVEDYTIKLLMQEIKKIIKITKKRKIIVFGLGNGRITVDSLGPKSVRYVFATKGYNFKNEVCCICPDVFAKTGIETSDIIEAITKKVKPDLIICVDTIATANISRLAVSFQISNAGITPGGGLHNRNKKITKELVETECLTIGVPLLIYGDNLIDYSKRNIEDLVLCPKDIDLYVNTCSKMIAKTINGLFTKELKNEEIELLNF